VSCLKIFWDGKIFCRRNNFTKNFTDLVFCFDRDNDSAAWKIKRRLSSVACMVGLQVHSASSVSQVSHWPLGALTGSNPASGGVHQCHKAAAFASMSHPQSAIEQLVWRSGLSLSLFSISSLKKKFGRSETNLCFLIKSLSMISSTGPVREIGHVNLNIYYSLI
jgi:hypothetical protein